MGGSRKLRLDLLSLEKSNRKLRLRSARSVLNGRPQFAAWRYKAWRLNRNLRLRANLRAMTEEPQFTVGLPNPSEHEPQFAAGGVTDEVMSNRNLRLMGHRKCLPLK